MFGVISRTKAPTTGTSCWTCWPEKCKTQCMINWSIRLGSMSNRPSVPAADQSQLHKSEPVHKTAQHYRTKNALQVISASKFSCITNQFPVLNSHLVILQPSSNTSRHQTPLEPTTQAAKHTKTFLSPHFEFRT